MFVQGLLVDYRDVAEAAAIAFATDELVNGTFELAAGGMVTRSEIATLMTRYAGREVIARDVEAGDAVQGMPDGFEKDGLLAMFADYTAHGFGGGNNLALRTILGRPAAITRRLPRRARPLTATCGVQAARVCSGR